MGNTAPKVNKEAKQPELPESPGRILRDIRIKYRIWYSFVESLGSAPDKKSDSTPD